MTKVTCWLAVAVLAAGSATGQTAPGAISDSTVRSLEAEFGKYRKVRVLTKWGPFDLERPQLTTTTIDYARLLTDTGYLPDSMTVPRPMPLTWVEAIHVPRNKPLNWALIGGLSGAVVGWLAGLVGGANPDDPCPDVNCGLRLTKRTGVLLFGSVGAAIGLVTGLVHAEWTPVYGPR